MELVTGAQGFIGKRLLKALADAGRLGVGMVRRTSADWGNFRLADLDDAAALRAACEGIETIYHCAGHAHAFSSLTADDEATHWRVNHLGTQRLLEAAADAGTQRIVYLSSIKAMADPGVACADEDWQGSPNTAYGQSKLAAEQAVLNAGRQYGMHVVCLRPAMVYGAGGRGNLERMGRLVARGLFPPLPETHNHRSLVHVSDLITAMQLVAHDRRANGRSYIIASPEAPSGRRLYDAIRQALDMPPVRYAVPAWSLRAAGQVGDWLELAVHKRMPLNGEAVERLLGSAWYSPGRIEQDLGWQASCPLREGLREMFGK